MEDLKKYVSQNRTLVWCGLAALLFIFAAFCPQLGFDIDKERFAHFSFNGMDVLFGMEVERVEVEMPGFAVLLMAGMLLAPIYLMWKTATSKNKPSASNRNLPLIICTVSLVLGLLFMFVSKKALTNHDDTIFVWNMKALKGMYLYLFAAFAGTVVAYLTRETAETDADATIDKQEKVTEESENMVEDQKNIEATPNDFQGKIKKFVGQYRTLVWCGIGVLLLTVAAFCPAISTKQGNDTVTISNLGEFEAENKDKPVRGYDLLFDKSIEKIYVNGIDLNEAFTDSYYSYMPHEQRMDKRIKTFGFESPRWLIILMFLTAAGLILTTVLKFPAFTSRKKILPLIFCGASFILGLIYMMTLENVVFSSGEQYGTSINTQVGFGIYLYTLIALAGAAMAYISKKK